MEPQDHSRTQSDTDPGLAGVIGGGARIIRAFLRSPKVAKTVRIALSNLDPEAAPELVRALFFGDTVLLFDLLSAAPALANAAILGAREGVAQLQAVPEELVDRFLPRLLMEVNAEALGETAALALLATARLLGRDNAALTDGLSAFEQGWARGFRGGLATREGEAAALLSRAVGGCVGAADRLAGHLEEAMAGDDTVANAAQELADGIRRVAQAHPELVSRVVRPIANAVTDALEGA